jgi:hypothetical protein
MTQQKGIISEIFREGTSLGKIKNKINTNIAYKYTKLNEEIELRPHPLFCNFPSPLFYFTRL